VRVGLGQDGIRDYWSPYGTGDMLARAWQLAYRSGYRYHRLIEGCVDVASRGGRACIDGQPWSTVDVVDDPSAGLAVGAPADLVVLAAETVTAAVMGQPARTLVIHDGRVVARDGALS
jgi:cytosine/adenosine deaminase-related metal-dependent hydrolase